MPFMETKNLLLQLPRALLQSGNEGENPDRDALFRPRMLFHHPVLALRHLIEDQKEKRRLKKNEF